MALEILGVVMFATSAVAATIRIAGKVASASAEQEVFKALMDTIDGKREEVIAQRNDLDSQLPDEKKQNIDKLVAETGRLVFAVRQLLGKPVYASKRAVVGGMIWVLTDKDRVMTHEALLVVLHGTLMVIYEELRGLHCNDRLPKYEEIYSVDTREQLLGGLKRWAEAEAKGEDEVLPRELGAKAASDFRRYSAGSRGAMIEEIKRRGEERKEAEKVTLNKSEMMNEELKRRVEERVAEMNKSGMMNEEIKRRGEERRGVEMNKSGAMNEEIKRRGEERRGAEKVALKKSGTMNAETRARMLSEVRMRAEERRISW